MLFSRGEYNDEINMEDIRMAGCCSSAHRSHNYICNEYISLQLQDEFRYWCRSSPWQTDLGQQGNHSVILVFLYRNTDHCNIAGGGAFPWHDRGYGSVYRVGMLRDDDRKPAVHMAFYEEGGLQQNKRDAFWPALSFAERKYDNTGASVFVCRILCDSYNSILLCELSEKLTLDGFQV